MTTLYLALFKAFKKKIYKPIIFIILLKGLNLNASFLIILPLKFNLYSCPKSTRYVSKDNLYPQFLFLKQFDSKASYLYIFVTL